jgi:hypothetical protein
MIPAVASFAATLFLTAGPRAALADAISNVPTTSSAGNPTSVQKYGRTWYEYYVTSTSNLPSPDPNATAPQVIATLPSGTKIDPPDSTLYPNNNSPQAYALTYTDASGKSQTTLSNSSGFTQSQLVLGLNNDATSGNQLFGLSFYGSGLKATNTASPSSGGLADLWLSFDNSVTKQPVFQSVTPNGVNIVPVVKTPATTAATTPTPTTTPTTPTPTPKPTTSTPTPVIDPTGSVPEPMSIMLWSVVGGLGVLRARAIRARRKAA